MAVTGPAAAGEPSLKGDLCYQVVTDRFADGNPGNNHPPSSPGLSDPSRQNWKLYWGGDFAGDYLTDPPGYFHHNGGVGDWDDPYETQYHNLFDLADFNHQHPVVDAYHKDAVGYWLDRGVDGVRVDAVKHMTAGWQRSAADAILADHDAFLFGEWYLGSKHDPLYGANVRFANDSGISVLDFYLNLAIRETFGQHASMHHLDQAISVTAADYRYPENLVTFIDNHDMTRFLTLQPDHHRLHQALAFLLTVAPQQITGLRTALPAGSHPDVLGGTLGGSGISVGSGGGADRPVTPFTLNGGDVAVWSYRAGEPGTPRLGSVAPTLTRAGNQLTVQGRGFGAGGTVRIGGVAAPVTSWSHDRIEVTVPAGVPTGLQPVTVTTGGGTSNTYEVSVLTGPQVPVTFSVTGAPPTNWGDAIYLTGSVAELGHWSTDPEVAIGPMLAPNYPDWFLVASVPACTTIEFKFVRITAGGAVTWENGPNHTYQVPCAGTDAVTVPWQH